MPPEMAAAVEKPCECQTRTPQPNEIGYACLLCNGGVIVYVPDPPEEESE